MIKITLDGREILAREGQTILDVCRENGIQIPTLCHDEQLAPAGVCLVCVVDVKDYGLVTSCNTCVADGIVIETGNDKVISARKKILELMLKEHYGDCIAPCQATCPAGQDVQGYNALITKGLYKEALELIMETNPLPSVCGRVCIRPCESECRRNLLDQPIAIASLKRFVADYVAASGQGRGGKMARWQDGRRAISSLPSSPLAILPFSEISPDTGFRVAVIGGGPGGLSAAYYLRKMGHAVTIFDAAPKLGGTLRYGIPDYRLPQDILDRDIANIISSGIEVKTACVLGQDFTLDGLLDNGFNAVFLATGALLGYDMRVEGEQLEGVLRGVDFLNAVAKGEPPKIGAKVAVIGGGNTAIDASRTALRLGAKEVTIVYRRSRDEMPATDWEVEEAEEEGVKIHYLAAPTKIVGDNGKVSCEELRGTKQSNLKMVCIKMVLGEPDASGRRSPVPIEGSEFVLDVDNVIAAIGQGPDVSFITQESGIKTSRDRIVADPKTQLTDRPGFFAGGDAVTGAASAIAAIAAGRRAARSIDQYLHGEKVKAAEKQFNSDKGELDEIDKDDFADIPREPKVKMPMLEPDVRRNNFEEIELGYTEEQARKEAERCLQCGCKAVDICKLRKLATEYGIEDTITQDNPLTPFSKGDSFRRYLIDDSHPFIVRDPNKCISCTLCLRVCRDVQGVGRTVVYNLNDNVAALPFRLSLLDANCESCGQCLERCPVGALTSRMALRPEHDVKTICSYCGVGCGIYLGVRGSAVVNVRGDFDNPINLSNLCVKGRFGYDFINSPERLTSPLIKRDGKFVKATWDEALEFIASKFSTFKGDQFAMLASAKCTNEENYVMQKFARGVMGTNNVDNYASLWHAPTIAGLTTSFGSGTMTNSINEIGEANCILSIGSNTTVSHPIIGLEIKKAVRKGATLIVASPRRIDLCRFADLCIQHNPGTEVALLMGMMRVIVDEGLSDTAFIKERCKNFEAFKESLKNFDIDTVSSITGVPSEKIIEAARVYATNKPSTILYALDITQCRKTKSSVSEANTHGIDNVMAIANLAMLTGNIGKPSTGVNPLRGQNNAQGACDMGALPNVYTDYQRVSDADIQRKFEQAWGVSLSDKPGLTLTEMFDVAIEEPVPSTSSGQALNEVKEKIKAMYLIGENPVLSDPNFNHVTPLENFTLRSSALVQSMFSNGVTEALEKLEFLVVQDLFLTETAQYADVVLPGATFAEKDGTFTNTERRVQRIRKAIEPIGDSKPDWWIVCEIAKKMNARGFDFEHPVEIMEEIASLTPSYGGISYDRIEELGLQWPCPTREHPGTPILHTAQFSRGKGQFVPLEYKPSAELPDDEYPPLLTAEHSLYHYHTGSLTRACFKK